jgi:hypothetical protein
MVGEAADSRKCFLLTEAEVGVPPRFEEGASVPGRGKVALASADIGLRLRLNVLPAVLPPSTTSPVLSRLR